MHRTTADSLSSFIGAIGDPKYRIGVLDLFRCNVRKQPMPEVPNTETTQLLRAWTAGDPDALKRLTPRVYRELRVMAARFLHNEPQGRSMQSVDLVHEVYLRLVDVREVDWQHRAHFFAVSATMMRRILLDRARRRLALKRGGKLQVVTLDTMQDVAQGRAREIVALDDALAALAQIDPRKAQIVELRYFGGLTVEETAEVVRVSADTVLRDWKVAKAWLHAELGGQT
jgi:RNA polymerase sigma factor (TIGR02999 family)